MKSFGVLYNRSESSDQDSKTSNFDMHINLWDLEGSSPFIDIGLMVRKFRDINKILILIPFKIDKSCINDLSDMFNEKNVPNLVFNSDCSFQRKNGDLSLKINENDNDKQFLLYNMNNEKVDYKTQDDLCLITFDFSDLNEDANYKEYSDLYIRFRINSDEIKKELFCNIKEKNLFLESAFISTQIVDLKINKKRNIGEEYLRKFRREHYIFAEFDKIHFLIMEPANADVNILGAESYECRKLEDEWREYIRPMSLKKDILVYHCRYKKGSDDLIKDYGKTIKITSSSTTMKIICIYITVIIIINLVSNAIFQFFSNFHNF